MTGRSVEEAAATACTLGEGPYWDGVGGRLYFVDILGKTLHWREEASGTLGSESFAKDPCAVALDQAGNLTLALPDGIYVRRNGALERVAAIDHGADMRLNDSQVDPAGNFWAGTMNYDCAPGAGALYRVTGAGEVETFLERQTIPNGIGWSLDGRAMYFAESTSKRLTTFAFDPESGRAGEVIGGFAVEHDTGVPDGLCVDAEGAIWIAIWGGAVVRRYDPSGALLDEIAVPALQPSSCAFGGPDLGTLYVTSARVGMSAEDLARWPQSGALFSVRPGPRGRLPNRFRA